MQVAMAMQISSYYSLYLGSNRNIFHRLKTAFRKVSVVTGIGGFIKLLAGGQIHPQACNSPQVAGRKDMDLKGRISQPLRNVPFLSLETLLKIFPGFENKFDFCDRKNNVESVRPHY